MEKTLTEPNRWEVHGAEEVAVALGDLRLRILQQPHQLAGAGANPDKLGVAAALWDGALVLAAYLVAQPRYRYLGACGAAVCPLRRAGACCAAACHCAAGSCLRGCCAALLCMHADVRGHQTPATSMAANPTSSAHLQACAAWSWGRGWAWWGWRWRPWELV